ncbi:inner centromere protein A isoform X1 [Acipenser oxyrinchus oxyrinchus]|uniref:Inner centromere protein A isoform X1 n=1 Tax=Acipenser oxyrinchus oxyrinchus TaxID=40147 RepID=A0AAD8FXJ6_ACIOX|nr:inner centromere protein A isoform X1 [Acipenser oxyrinchus oxyrinchus]
MDPGDDPYHFTSDTLPSDPRFMADWPQEDLKLCKRFERVGATVPGGAMDALSKDASSLLEVFDQKLKEYVDDVENNHMVWLLEIQEEASKMFCSESNCEPELMPKTPSQKRKGRKRPSVGGSGTQNPNKRRISKGRRSNVRRSSSMKVQVLSLLAEEVEQGGQQGWEAEGTRPKRSTRKAAQAAKEAPSDCQAGAVLAERRVPLVEISSEERRSAELAQQEWETSSVPGDSEGSGRSVSKLPIAEGSSGRVSGCETGDTPKSHKRAPRSSVRRSIGGQRSLLSIRESMTRESLRRASRRSFLKKKALLESSASSTVSGKNYAEVTEEEEEEEEEVKHEEAVPAATPESPIPVIVIVDTPPKRHSTRSATRSSTQAESQAAPAPQSSLEAHTLPSLEGARSTLTALSVSLQKPGCKRAVNEVESSAGRGAQQDEGSASPKKKTPSPPSRTQNVMKPHMKSFLQTVQKNQLLMTPLSVGRSTVKSFIKRTTPLKVDLKEKERHLLEVLKKKLEQEVERKKKMEEDKRRKLEEMKRKREVRLRKVIEAREREEQKEEEKKKKIEQKLAQFDEKNDKLREERLAEEKAKRKVNTKKTEEVESRRRQEEEARRNKIQAAEEEERLLLKRREEELERGRKLAEARRLQELELERKREQEKVQAQRERERVEKEKADALQREVARAAREKLALKAAEEKARLHKEAEERRKLELLAKEKQVAVNIVNVTINIEKSPQSYQMTPKGGNMQNLGIDDYGMDLNSDDSTDDEGEPKKPLPSWAEGKRLNQAVMHQYYNPIDLERHFRKVLPIKLEEIFCKSKPRYFKRTSSAVWHSPPGGRSNTANMGTYSLGKF